MGFQSADSLPQQPVELKLKAMGRAVDMVEIGTGMYDLARWAKEDVASGKSTEEDLSEDRLTWYQERLQKFTSLTADSFPDAIKTWRGVTVAEDQAEELDYFNVSLIDAPTSVTGLTHVLLLRIDLDTPPRV